MRARSPQDSFHCCRVRTAGPRLAPLHVCMRSPPSPPSRLPDDTPTSTEPPSPARRNKLWTAAQLVLAAVLLWYIGKTLVEQWAKVRNVPLTVDLRWGMIASSALVTLAGFCVLIETWRRIMIAWGETLDFSTAARVWFVSNLVRYLPGSTVLQIPAMA